ncbi:MAG: hypothetical protein KJ018_21670, partial [Burkholderiales bacterium]|nr:hypothetical protein [Burkholderiales bacterium]
WWKLRAGMPREVAVHLTVKPARFEMSYKRINGLQKPLIIEWSRFGMYRDRSPSMEERTLCALSRGANADRDVHRDRSRSAAPRRSSSPRPDGRKHFVFFEDGNPIGAHLSQADGTIEFRASKGGDVHHIEAGNERCGIVAAFVFGG